MTTARRARRRVWPVVLVVVAVTPVLYVGLSVLQVWLSAHSSYGGTADAIVVMGAAQYDGEPSPVLRSRLDHAAALFVEERAPFVVVTGGGREGDRTTEAKAGYEYLRRTVAIPEDRILLEVDGRTTYESLAASARFLRRQGLDEVILVSDPYHARRINLVASELGLRAHVSPTDGAVPLDRLLREGLAVAAGQLIGFRRLERFQS
jgi:uncharacterized SAM-binding protein YcdF (DUF218 family)